MDFKLFDSTYFDKVAKTCHNSEPGVFEFSKLTNEPEKFKFHLTWYSMCAPEGFNKVVFISDTQFEIVKSEIICS